VIVSLRVFSGTFSRTDVHFRASQVRNINRPVLLLWGEDDPFGLSMAESIQSALSSAVVDFTLLESCGHYWHECPNEFFLQVRLHTEGLDG
jgi:pimeloyl-ACP methyl ester carboxylesterase